MNDGGPAFPSPAVKHPGFARESHNAQQGMSLRDWFAGRVIPQVLAGNITAILNGCSAQEADAMARDAYKLADAMLAEREKKDGK